MLVTTKRSNVLVLSFASLLCLLLLFVTLLQNFTEAWVAPPSVTRVGPIGCTNAIAEININRRHCRNHVVALESTKDSSSSSSSSSSSNNNNGGGMMPSSVVQRASIESVSVSPKGFHVMLGTESGYLPIQVTADPLDAYAATSAESLTIIQLLSGVDMAGAVLPPDILARMVVLHCEAQQNMKQNQKSNAKNDEKRIEELSPAEQEILDFIQGHLPPSNSNYTDAHVWLQNRIKLPTVTLDQLRISSTANGQIQFTLECAIKEFRSTLSFVPNPDDVLSPISYRYMPGASDAFVCLALALRYKTPIVLDDVQSLQLLSSEQEIMELFPQYTTVANLQKTSTRVTQNIERGFEVHKLTGALRIAQERGDIQAVKSIRAKLDEYDSMDELPTLETSNNSSGVDPSLFDNDDNVLQ